MKKLLMMKIKLVKIVALIIIGTLNCLVTNAQQLKGTAALDKTGGWIFNDWGNSNNVFYNPMGPGDNNFPKITFFGATGNMMPTGVLKEKITAIRDIFKAAYPNPQGCSMLYSLKAAKEKTNNDPRFIMLSIDAHGIEHDGKGGLAALNIASHQGDNKYGGDQPSYDGLLSVCINKIPHENSYGFFTKQTQFDEVLKTKQIPNLSGVYLMPPQNNFSEAGQYFSPKNLPLPNAAIGNKADDYIVYRSMEYENHPQHGIVERHMDKIILTPHGKLPYKPIKRKEFLALLILDIAFKKQQLITNYESDKSEKTTSQITNYNNNISSYNWQETFVKKIEDYYKNDLDKNATISAVHKNIVKDLSYYTINSRNYNELKLDVIKDIFISDSTKGYTLCKFIKYYKSANDEDIQSIMVNWYYEIPVANNPNYKEHPAIDSRSWYQAIKNKLDWSKLQALLTKIN
jgi:hypothetical protein